MMALLQKAPAKRPGSPRDLIAILDRAGFPGPPSL